MTYLVPVEKAEIVSFDLDSTIAWTEHRWPMIDREGGTTDWQAYSRACKDDTPGPALALAQYLTKLGVPLVICSARDISAKDATVKWLHDNGVFFWHITLSSSDDEHNRLGHGEWKAQKLLQIQEKLGRKIAFHVDDWSDVAVATAKVGITTILVHTPNSTLVDEKLA